jgi:hypothetical protein
MFNFIGWESFLLWLVYAGIPLAIALVLGFLLGAWIY